MPHTTDDHLKANYGVALVTTRLSAECLVRPVAAGTDVGIDLYCESVAEGKPFLHFWVQVKTGSQCEVEEGGGGACCRFEKRHLEYWKRQPVPVFAALVPVAWPVEHEPDVHVIDVTGHLLDNDLPEGDSVRLRSDRVWKAGDPSAARSFLAGDVPAAAARRLCAQGVVGNMPTPGPEYVYYVPSVPISRHRRAILDQIRRTASFSIVLMAWERTCDTDLWRRMARVLTAFDDSGNWETHAARACAHDLAGRRAEAAASCRTAIESIENDRNISVQASPWPETLDLLRRQEAEGLDFLASDEAGDNA